MPARRPPLVAWLLIATSVLGLGGWMGLELHYAYEWPGFPPGRTPSLRLELAESLGQRSFYSQFGQDKWILGRVFPDVEDGFFVDVGAADAERHSNTRALEDAGWSGIAVEPLPTGDWDARRARLFREVVYSVPGETVEFRTAGFLSGIDEHIETWKQHVEEQPVVEFTTTTLEDVLERAGAPGFVHYLSLDTEGAEYEILRNFPFSEYRFGALTIEHNGEEPKRSQIRELLERNGYRFERQHVVEDWYLPAD